MRYKEKGGLQLNRPPDIVGAHSDAPTSESGPGVETFGRDSTCNRIQKYGCCQNYGQHYGQCNNHCTNQRPQYTTSPAQTQHNNTEVALADQAKAQMARAINDDDWQRHFAIYLAVWPLAFASEMEVTL